MTAWTEERQAFMVKCAEEGKSAQECGDLLGITRNAVLGRANRTNIRFQGVGSNGRRKGTGVPRAPSNVIRFPKRALDRLVNLAPVEPPIGSKQIWELRRGECRWPHGEGPYHFCAAEALPSAPYCAYHARIAFGATPSPRLSEEERAAKNAAFLALKRGAA